VPSASVLVAAEPGGFQVQAALQPLAGWLPDGADLIQAGQFGAARRRSGHGAAPVRQPVRFRCLVAVDPGEGVPIPACRPGPGPVDRVIGGAVALGGLVQRGQRNPGQPQPGHGLLVARAAGAPAPSRAPGGRRCTLRAWPSAR